MLVEEAPEIAESGGKGGEKGCEHAPATGASIEGGTVEGGEAQAGCAQAGSKFPHAGHCRRDLTEADVRFYPVYSYLIVYRPESSPLQIVSVLHASRDVPRILAQRP